MGNSPFSPWRWPLGCLLLALVSSCTCSYVNDEPLPQGRFWGETITMEYRESPAPLAPTDPVITVTYALTSTGYGTVSMVDFSLGLKLDGQPIPLSALILSIDDRYGQVSNAISISNFIRDRDIGANGGFKIAAQFRQALTGENPDIEVTLREVVIANTNLVATNTVVVHPRKRCI